MSSARAILTLLTAAPLLSGCIAAAALPVLAAGGVVKTRMDEPSKPVSSGPRVAIPADQVQVAPASPPQPGAVSATPPAATVRDYAFADGSRVTVTNAIALPAPAPAPPAAAPARTMPGAPTPVAVVKGSIADFIDAPGTLAPAPAAARPPIAAGTYAAFADFAATQAAIPAIGSERQSALLVDAGSMQARTRTCSIHPPAVLIDVDPAGSTFDPARAPAADAEFVGRLAALRTDGVTIGWVSARTADRAGDLRRLLRSSGLDPAGRDELVLLRFPEERKQTRRDDFAKAYCVIALAGDERADFDELFTYLRDPARAQALDSLIGKGWFLVPSPLQ